jgi:YggT family protein
MIVIYQILTMIISTVSMLLIIWFILGLLFAFNVVGRSNQFLVAVNDSLSRLFEPVLRPIRRILPDTGAMDFSPLILIMIINALQMILNWSGPY